VVDDEREAGGALTQGPTELFAELGVDVGEEKLQ